jgi:hypothetical protein
LARRASRPDRAALRVALDCSEGRTELPTVFASRHGEVRRSVELLDSLARSRPCSPAQFGLSVHNVAAGLFSIARADRSAATSLAAGTDSLPMAVLEAVGILREGAPEVLVVMYDEPVPSPFEPYVAEQETFGALALRLALQAPRRFSLELLPPADAPPLQSSELEAFRDFLDSAGEREFLMSHRARSWRWSRAA